MGLSNGHEMVNLHFHDHENWVHGFLTDFSWDFHETAVGSEWIIVLLP